MFRETLSELLQGEGAPSREALAEWAGVKPSYLSLILAGKRERVSKAVMVMLLTGLGIPFLEAERMARQFVAEQQPPEVSIADRLAARD